MLCVETAFKGYHPKGFFKQFKSKESFQKYFGALFKQGIEQILQSDLDEHPGYLKHTKETIQVTTGTIQIYPCFHF